MFSSASGASIAEINITPLVGQFLTMPQPDAGLEPEVAVPTTTSDLAAGRDAQMQEALI